jgi:hypothetical protein
MCGNDFNAPRIILKALWKKSSAIPVPNSYLNDIIAGGAFGSGWTPDTIRNAIAKNGINTVRECYALGIDPEDPDAAFIAKIKMMDGKPQITWEPELSAAASALRKYQIWGATSLVDDDWEPVIGNEASFNFFKVKVEMR